MSVSDIAQAPVARQRHAPIALALGVAAAAATLLVLPYALDVVQRAPDALHLSAPTLLLGALQSFGIFAFAAWFGLRVGYRYGLDAPLLRRWLGGGAASMTAAPAWGRAVALGLGSGALVLALLALWPIGIAPVAVSPPWWKGLLASFYGGTAEEILLRLCVMSALVWCGARLVRGAPTRAVYVGAIVSAAVLFGVGHLPLAAQLMGHLDAIAVLQVIVLNALCGLVFGWLFWRHGLEHAMVAHFSADLVLHVAAPLAANLVGGTS